MQHLHEVEIAAIRNALHRMVSNFATIRGLREIISLDTSKEVEIFRNELDTTALGIEDFLKQLYLLLSKIENNK